MWPAFEWRTSELMCGSYCTHTDAQSRQGSVTVSATTLNCAFLREFTVSHFPDFGRCRHSRG
jgi:hypothetical protein